MVTSQICGTQTPLSLPEGRRLFFPCWQMLVDSHPGGCACAAAAARDDPALRMAVWVPSELLVPVVPVKGVLQYNYTVCMEKVLLL